MKRKAIWYFMWRPAIILSRVGRWMINKSARIGTFAAGLEAR